MNTRSRYPSLKGLARWSLAGRGALALVFALFVTLAAPRAVAAQDTPPAPTEATAQAGDPEPEVVSDEITVTARKREETIQEVPFSVVAPSEEELRSRGAESIEGVAANVAGFSVQNLGPGQSQVALRGISSGQIVRDQPGVKEQVGVYLDESVISLSLFTPDIDLFDVGRVEVLRGPQGTLFGSGSESGTVRYITNPPKIGVTEAFGEFSVNGITDGEAGGSTKVAVNAPIGATSALRVSAYYTKTGGFVDAVQPGLRVKEDVNSSDRSGVRLAFKAQPNEQLTITPRIIYQEVNADGWNRADAFNILGNPFTTTRPAVKLGEREQFTQIEEPFSDEFLLADLNIEYKFDAATLTSISSYTDRDVLVVRDATALTASITGGSIGLPQRVYSIDAPLDDATKVKVLTQEVRLSGDRDRLDWVGGLFYSKIDRDYDQSLLVSGFEAASGIPTRGLRAPKDVLFFSDLSYELEQTALFGEATWAVSPEFDLTGGLRYYNFKEDRTQVFDGIFGNDNNGTALVATAGDTSANGFAPRLIGSYKLNEKTALNAQISKGFRLGGINDPLNVPLCTPQDLRTFGGQGAWKDETLWNYEVGAKTRVLGGRGSVNVAAFYTDITDLQATVTAGSCSSRVIFNVPKARSQGLEIELAAAPNAHFDYSLSMSYADSELSSTLTSTDAAGNVSVVSGIQKGNRLPSVPKFQAAASATYQRQIRTNWLGYATATYQHTGSRFTQIGDQAAGFGSVNLRSFGANSIGGPLTSGTFNFDPELPAYDLFNVRFGIAFGKWDVALFVNNLTDERALLALDQERGTRARVGFLVNQPRTIGLNTRVQFK